ncbi:hypothetical protein V565_062630 [Rhizoctonia solani 123E]|uniref:50S ribosome-binding GTPase n=1 Tax=Rhizoctonia solani 123E TaxID=1423351 RepID=A0A074RWS7_9AGAM|nr:hypothetical protein V565_062630 [Rhizoctonia solani 123E]
MDYSTGDQVATIVIWANWLWKNNGMATTLLHEIILSREFSNCSTYAKFANVASGSSMTVGRGLQSCTKRVETTPVFLVDGSPVVVVDCPGFDDTYLSETETLASVASFLTTTYSKNRKLAGLLYLHKITDTRVGGVSFRHMNMFRELCGTDSLKNVVYVTNMWSEPMKEDEIHRENELRESDEFFGVPLAEGAQMARHQNTKESAHSIIRALLQRGTTVPQISRELVDRGLKLEETNAGAVLGSKLEEEMQELADEIRQLRSDHAQALQTANEMYERMLEEQGWEEIERYQALEWQIALLEGDHELDQIAREQEWEDYMYAVDASLASALSEMYLREE